MVPQVLAVVFTGSATVALLLTLTVWRRRHESPAAMALVLLAGGIAAWSAAGVPAVLTKDPERAEVFAGGLFPGIVAVVAGFYCLSHALMDRFWRLSPRAALLLLIEPILILAAAATNSWHHLVFGEFTLGVHDTLAPEFGPLFWAHTVYSYALIGSVVFQAARAFRKAPRTHWHRYGWTLFGAIPPMVANLLALVVLDGAADLTPLGFTVTVLVAYWGLSRQTFIELIPVARERVFNAVSDLVITIDVEGRILDANAAAVQLLRQTTRTRRMSTPTADSVIGVSVDHLLGPLTLHQDAETTLTVLDVRGHGTDLDVRGSPLRDQRNSLIGWVLVARDITELNRQRRELREANLQLREQLATIEALRADLAEQAVRDELTGLHNRRYLMEVLEHEVSATAVGGGRLGVALLDIDHFKRINDRYGHGAGDEVLRQFATHLTSFLRPGDVAARHGGEEFVVLLPGTDTAQAHTRVEMLRARVATCPVRAGDVSIDLTFSAGIATGTGRESPAALLHAADQALYAAKGAGRNRVELAVFPVPATIVPV